MTIAQRIAGPDWATYSPKEVMEAFAAEQRTRVGLIERDGHTFQLLNRPGVEFRCDDWITGWAIVQLVEH